MRRATEVAAAVALAGMLTATAFAAAPENPRALARASGGDRLTAIAVAQVLLARPLDMQLTKVRCERSGDRRFCGLTLAGVKFHRSLNTASFDADVDALIRDAFATDAAIAEVDLWVTVPADAGKGAIVSGDFARPTSATVYATTATRASAIHPSTGPNVFWDPTFRAELAAGTGA